MMRAAVRTARAEAVWTARAEAVRTARMVLNGEGDGTELTAVQTVRAAVLNNEGGCAGGDSAYGEGGSGVE